MKPSLALDPGLLAIPAIAKNETEVAKTLAALIEVARNLRNKAACDLFILEDSTNLLSTSGLFPASTSIIEMLRELNLSHVYTAEEIRRATIDVLSRANSLEKLSGRTFFIPNSFSANPDVTSVRHGAVREGLELTLLHCVFASMACHPTMIRVLIADFLQDAEISVDADVDCIHPPVAPADTREFPELHGIVRSAGSIASFIEGLPPEIIWRHAEEAREFEVAIGLAARNVRRSSGCKDPHGNCERFAIGPSFVDSLNTWEGVCEGKHAFTTLEVCARIVARLPKDQPTRFFKAAGAKGKTEFVERAVDNAQAWRTHIGKGHEAMRLLFWRRSDGSIEFANIGAKSELEIF